MSVPVLPAHAALPALIDNFRARYHDFALLEEFLAAFILFLFLVLDPPQLDQLVIGREQLGSRGPEGVDPFDGVDLLRD